MSARAQGTRVEVMNARTSSSRTWANPDGSFSSDIYAGPNWTLNSASEWVEVDTRLSAGKDGSVRPTAAAVDVTVSGARDAATSAVATVKIAKADLAAVAAARTNTGVPVPASDWVSGDAASFTVGFAGALPTPVLSDNEARYVNVAPGRDLRVKVLPAGVETFVDLTSRPDSIPKGGVGVALQLSVAGLEVAENGTGGLVFTDPATGKQVASTPQARIWDATKGEVSGESEHGIVVDTELRPVKSGGFEVVATVPASFFDTPGLVYPVTVDPSSTVDLTKDTFVEKGYDTTVFGSDPELKVGTYDSGTHVGRSYVMFTMSSAPLLVDTVQQSTVVDNAKLQLWLHHSASCTASLVGIKYLTGSFSETTTNWNNKPSQSASIYQVSDAKRDDSGGSCAEGWLDSSTGTETKDIVQGWVNGDYANYGYALGASETSSTGWKVFYSSDYSTSARRPKLTITYHHKPRTPSATTIAGQVAGTGKVGTLTPQIRAKVGDWDGGNVRAKVEVWHLSTMVWSGYTGYTASGSNTPWVTVGTALTNGNTYTVRTYGNDGSLNSGAYDSASFTVDKTKPAAPSVSSTAFPSSSWASADSGTFTFTDIATDTATWEWSTDGGTTWDAGTGGMSFTTPTVTVPGGWVDLKVRAIDATGNVSDPTTYSFGVPAVTKPTTEDSTTRFMTLGASGPSTANNVTFQYKSDGGSTWTDIPVAAVTLAGSPVTAWSNVATTATTHTSDAPADLVWDMQATLGTDAAADVRAVFKNSTSTVATSVNAASARVDSHAYGLTYATAGTPAGPVSLLTGNLAVSAADASVASYGGGLAVSRTFNSDDPTYTPTVGPAFFGPGWSTTLASTESDWTSAEDLGSQVRLTDSDGGKYYFQHTTGSSYVPVADAEAAGLSLKSSGTGAGRLLTLTTPDGSTVVLAPTDPSWGGTPSLSTPDVYRVDHTSSAGVAGSSSYEYNTDGTPKVLIAPHPTSITCTSATVSTGCRMLAFTYADVDTGAGVANRLTTVTLKTKDTTGTAVNLAVACYTYDSGAGHRIHQVWDPRLGGSSGWSTTCGSPVQAVTYGYDGDGRITSITPPGLNATTIAYDSTSHRLDHVSQSDGTNTLTTTIVYDPFDPTASTTTTSDRPDLSAGTAADWGQTDLALASAIVFVPGESASGTDLRAGTVYGIDAAGRIVNTAVYSGSGQGGWRVDTTEYDDYGNPIRTLTAAARDRALDPASYTNELTGLGLSTSTPAVDIAAALDTRYTYSTDGTDLLDTFGPARYIQLANGTNTVARPHVHNTYGTVDYPDTTPGTWTSGAPLHTVTTTTESASLSLEPTATNETDTTTTSYAYGLSAGEHPGWDLRQPMTTTVENGTTDITTTTRYEVDGSGYSTGSGNVTEQRQPSATSSSDPGTRKTTYYTAGTHNPSTCTSIVWYGQVCKIEPGAQPTTAGMAQLPVTTYTYDTLLRPTIVTETVVPSGGGSSTRTTTTTYKNSGTSPQTDTVTVAATGTHPGTTVPATTYGYDSSTGLPTTVTTSAGTLTTGYDALGRVTTYSEGSSAPNVTTAYDSRGRIASKTWKTNATTTLASQTYAYADGGSGDYRGGLVSITDSDLTSAITGVYGPGGELVSQAFPGGITQTFTTDATGDTTSTTWADGSSNVFLSDTQVSDIHGRWAHEDITGATAGWQSRDYTYDLAGRLTVVGEQRDDGATGCITRKYVYDVNSNRTSAATHPADTDGSCTTSTTATSTQTLAYDNADRLENQNAATNIAYDAWGRTTTLPVALASAGTGNGAIAYFSNDLVYSTTQDSKARTWTLDPANRLAAMTTTGLGSTALTNHYSDTSSDSPAWTSDTASGGTTTTRRYVPALGGYAIEAATVASTTTTTLQLTGLHGDILRTTNLTATGSPDGTTIDTTEFGIVQNPATGATTTGPRYGWLGGKQRASDTGDLGLTLMGIRLYAPLMGRFSTTDSVLGGTDNAYTYPVDPVNDSDLSGRYTTRGRACEGYIWQPGRECDPDKYVRRVTRPRQSLALSGSACFVFGCVSIGFAVTKKSVYRTASFGFGASWPGWGVNAGVGRSNRRGVTVDQLIRGRSNCGSISAAYVVGAYQTQCRSQGVGTYKERGISVGRGFGFSGVGGHAWGW